MTNLRDLLTRLESGEGTNNELDRIMTFELLGWVREARGRDRKDWLYTPTGQRKQAWDIPRLTTSVDAALAFKDAVLPSSGMKLTIESVFVSEEIPIGFCGYVSIWAQDYPVELCDHDIDGYCRTPGFTTIQEVTAALPRAILISVVKAKIAMEGRE